MFLLYFNLFTCYIALAWWLAAKQAINNLIKCILKITIMQWNCSCLTFSFVCKVGGALIHYLRAAAVDRDSMRGRLGEERQRGYDMQKGLGWKSNPGLCRKDHRRLLVCLYWDLHCTSMLYFACLWPFWSFIINNLLDLWLQHDRSGGFSLFPFFPFVYPNSKVWILLTRWLLLLLLLCMMWTTQAAPTASCATQEVSWPSSTMTQLCWRVTMQLWPSRSPREMISATSSRTSKGTQLVAKGLNSIMIVYSCFGFA